MTFSPSWLPFHSKKHGTVWAPLRRQEGRLREGEKQSERAKTKKVRIGGGRKREEEAEENFN